MKNIFFIALLLQISISMAQNNADQTTEKPSWSEEMPEMVDTPDLGIDSAIDTDIDMDMEIDGMDRRDLFNDAPSEAVELTEKQIAANELAKKQAKEAEELSRKQAEEAEALIEKQAAEAKKLAEEQAAADELAKEQAADELAKEQAAAEELAKEQNVTDELTKEQEAVDALAKEQAVADTLAKEQDAADALAKEQAAEQQLAKDIVDEQVADNKVAFKWVKIKNYAPKYPKRAVRSGEEGWVELEIELSTNGDIVNAIVVNSYENATTFNQAAIRAVKKWKYEAPINLGIIENQFKVVKIVFKL